MLSVESNDGTNNRKVGMIGVLSNTPSLYKPGAFGGATIEDPWECMARCLICECKIEWYLSWTVDSSNS